MAVDWNLLLRHEGKLHIANPQSHHHHRGGIHPSALTSRPATHRDVLMTLSAASTEALDILAKENWMPHELENAAKALGYTEGEISKYQFGEEQGTLSPHEGYFRTELISETMNALFKHRGAVTIPGIVAANEAILPEFELHYLEIAREIFGQMVEVEKTVTSGCVRDNADWLKLYAGKGGFQRQAELLGQVQMRLGRFAVEVKEDTPPWEVTVATD